MQTLGWGRLSEKNGQRIWNLDGRGTEALNFVGAENWTLGTSGVGRLGIFFPVVTYGHESWTIKKVEGQRIGAFELWC